MRRLMLAAATASLAVPVIPAPALAHGGDHYEGKIWRDKEGRYRCKRPDGTTGLIVGAAGGALIGRAIDTRGRAGDGHHPRRSSRRPARPQDRSRSRALPLDPNDSSRGPAGAFLPRGDLPAGAGRVSSHESLAVLTQ